MNAQQRKRVRRLSGYVTALRDELLSRSDRRREKQETLREARNALLNAEQRFAEISADRFSYPREKKQQYVDEAAEELADARNRVADVEADLRAIAERQEELHADLRPAAKIAEALLKVSGEKHEDFPALSGSTMLGMGVGR